LQSPASAFNQARHCEERGEEAIQTKSAEKVWIASLALAMTLEVECAFPQFIQIGRPE
jgi:hypothetical protein